METIKEYQELKYPIKIEPDSECGYVVTYPDLQGVFSSGPTIEAAIQRAEFMKNKWLEVAIERGDKIPLPGEYDSCKGAISLRVPVSLHRFLKMKAHNENVSLNQLILYLLAKASLGEGYKGSKIN